MLCLKIFDYDEFRGPFKGAEGAQRVLKGPEVAVLVIETYFLASRLNVIKKKKGKGKKILCLKKIVFYEFGGPFKWAKSHVVTHRNVLFGKFAPAVVSCSLLLRLLVYVF